MESNKHRDRENHGEIMEVRSFPFFVLFFIYDEERVHDKNIIFVDAHSYIERMQGEYLLYQSINYNHVG